jgi:hypothetical protein
MELVAWLTATFRLPKGGSPTTSTINFQPYETALYNDPSINGHFRISLCTRMQEQEVSDSSSVSAKCWLPLFREGVLACGFPIARREEGEGLEIPFELMTLFAGVRGSLVHGDGNILVGPCRVLFPTRRLHEAVQWHYIEAHDNQALIDVLNSIDNRVCRTDSSDFAKLRAFLGYYKHALVYAGTQEGIQSSTIGSSLVPKSNSRLEVVRECSLSAGFTTHGSIGAVAGKIVFPRSLQVSLAEGHLYENRLESASERPLLVYDLSTRSAWLVSELSMVLHMAHKYLSDTRVQSLGRRDGDPVPWPSLPYAEPLADGGKSAHAAIQESGHIPLYIRHEDNKPQEFWNEIDNILKDFGTIRTEESIKKASAGWKPRGPRLQGWDFNDLANKEETVFQRELSSTSKKSSWWSLAEADEMVVLFGCGFGQLIRPNLEKTRPYKGWESTPGQAELLTASMRCVKRLASKCINTDNYVQLTSELFWHKPVSRACSVDSTCTDGCLFIQELRTRNALKELLSNFELNPPSKRLFENDAVIFGDIKYYHEVTRESYLP